MTKAIMALGAERVGLTRTMLGLDDMELVKKAEAALKRITTPKEDPFFTNPVNFEYFRQFVK